MAKSKKPSGSLRDQLLQAGLASAKQVKKAEKGAHRQNIRVKKGVEVDETREAIEAARLEKQKRDKEKNEALNQKALQKSLRAQAKQLATNHTKRVPGEAAYKFADGKKVKTIYVSETNRSELNKGYLAIVRVDENYDLVPEPVARKIEQRLAGSLVYLYDRTAAEMDEDDPYKDYPIPDDLEW